MIALGDSFHDGGGPARLGAARSRRAREHSSAGREWIWIAGNHDPRAADRSRRHPAHSRSHSARSRFRHEPTGAAGRDRRPPASACARVSGRGRTVTRRCFASDGARLVMPAFGAYAGGLNVRDRAFADVFGSRAFTAHMLGERRLYALVAERCMAD